MIDRFDEFWQLYPRKVDRGHAEKAWGRLSNKMHDKILAALPEYVFSDNPKFVPYPATWLNGKHWMDEQETKPQKKHDIGWADWQPSDADKEYRKRHGLPDLKD